MKIEREREGMALSQTRLSDTVQQPCIRPAECYFQLEMTHQLYHGGVNEREIETRESLRMSERVGLYSFIKALFKKSQKKKYIYTSRQAKGKPVPKEAKARDSHPSMDHARPRPFTRSLTGNRLPTASNSMQATVSGSQFTYKTTSPTAF